VTVPEPATPVNDLADRFWESILRLSPTTATMYGDERYGDRLPDPGPEGRGEARRLAEDTRREADAISTDGLSVENRITLDMVKVVCDLTVRQDNERIDVLTRGDVRHNRLFYLALPPSVFSPVSVGSWNFGPHDVVESDDPSAAPCMHVAPLARVSLGPKSEYRFRYWLVVGTAAQIAIRLDELWKKYSEERAELK
jgi:uncharacterized protein (DUF885 family)